MTTTKTEPRDRWFVAPHKLKFELRFNGRTYASGVKHDLEKIAGDLNELAERKAQSPWRTE